MNEYDFEEKEYEVLNDAIDDIIDCCDIMNELLPIVGLINKYNYDMTSVYKKNILNVLKKKKDKKMNQEELEDDVYYFEDID